MTSDGRDGPGAAPPAADDLLGELLDEVRQARRAVAIGRRGPVARDALARARADLVRALERYATALEVRRLPVPRELRSELQLNRGLAGHS